MTVKCLVGGIAALALCSTAHAQFFQVQTLGNLQVTGGSPTQATYIINAAGSTTVGSLVFTGLTTSITQTFQAPGTPDSLAGSFTLLGATPADTLIGSINGGYLVAGQQDPAATSFHTTYAGRLNFTSGTGAFAGLSGFGEFSGWAILSSQTAGNVGIVVMGELVPSPGAAGLLGVAGLVAARRRRR